MMSRLPGLNPTGGSGQVVTATSFFLLRGRIDYQRARIDASVLLRREGERVDVVWSRES